jgi:sRNA-binding protein
MTSQLDKKDRTRGLKEYTGQIEALRAKWPKAFPEKFGDVRPLASGAVHIIADTFSWSQAYTRGVLQRWKTRDAYCYAVLGHSKRITLDGEESGEDVDDRARTDAKSTIDRRKQKREQATRTATRPMSAASAATDVKAISATPIPIAIVPAAPAPPETVFTVDELRARVRASLARRSA